MIAMKTIDPERERQRLAELYAGQTNEELENVAAQASELTEIARETLRAELSKRDLYAGQLDEIEQGHTDAEFRDLVTVRTFSTLAEAEMAKGLLDASGIESFLFDENMARVYVMTFVGGARLQVDAENAEAANRLLNANDAGDLTPEELETPSEDSST
jgi:hypothetical protein